MKLICIRECIMDDGEKSTTVGRVYPVESMEGERYLIVDDAGDNHYFTEIKKYFEIIEDEGGKEKMEFKVGDVCVVTDRLYGHSFEIGEVVVIDSFTHENHMRAESMTSDKAWWVTKDEIELIDTQPTIYTHEEVMNILGVTRDEVQEVAQSISTPHTPDMVNHPPHYTEGGIETLDFILAKSIGMTGAEAYLFGNIIKYMTRFPHKGSAIQDLEKAQFYLNKLIEVEKEM